MYLKILQMKLLSKLLLFKTDMATPRKIPISKVFLNIPSKFLILIQTTAARLNVRQLLNSSLIYIWITRYLSLPFLLFHNLAYLVLTNFSLILNSGMYLTRDSFFRSKYRFPFLVLHFRIFKVFGILTDIRSFNLNKMKFKKYILRSFIVRKSYLKLHPVYMSYLKYFFLYKKVELSNKLKWNTDDFLYTVWCHI